MTDSIQIIRKEFRQSEEARYIHRLHGVLLVLLGLSTTKAGKLLGDPQRTVAHWVTQFKARGLDGLREAEKSGRPQILNDAQQEALRKALSKSPKDAGLIGDVWTGALVLSFLKKRYRTKITLRHCYRLLKASSKSTEG